MNTNKTFADALSTWSKNGLIRLYGEDILNEPEVIAWLGMNGLLKHAIGLGPKSLKEIALLLCDFYYIDDIEKWLDV
jgi:hypothetical protein